MAKNRASKIAETAIKQRQTKVDIAIEDRLAGCGRKESEHIIYIGNLVERALKGEIGAVIKALTVGRISTELQGSRGSTLSADRVLGRLEMAEYLWNDFEQFVLDKDKLLRPSVENMDGVHAYNYGPD